MIKFENYFNTINHLWKLKSSRVQIETFLLFSKTILMTSPLFDNWRLQAIKQIGIVSEKSCRATNLLSSCNLLLLSHTMYLLPNSSNASRAIIWLKTVVAAGKTIFILIALKNWLIELCTASCQLIGWFPK